jgi:hypothetical protein
MRLIRRSTWLLLALATSLPLLPCAVAQQPAVAAESATVAEQYLFAAANQERATRGLPLLHRDPLLVRGAAQHAQAMAERGTLSHQFPGEPTLPTRAANAGLAFSLITENVGVAPSAVEIHDLWMHSEHHRTNLLDPEVDAVGIRVIERSGQFYAVEDFARTLRVLNIDQQEAAIGALIAQSSRSHSNRLELVVDATASVDARRTCAMSTGFAGARKPWFVQRFTTSDLTRLPAQLLTQLASGRYHQAVVGACATNSASPFASYNFAVLLYP